MCGQALLPLLQLPPTQCSIANGLYVCLSFQDVLLSREVPQKLLEDIVQVLLNLGMVRQEATDIFNNSWPLLPALPLPSPLSPPLPSPPPSPLPSPPLLSPASPLPSPPLNPCPVACCGHDRLASGGSGALRPLAHCQQHSGSQQQRVLIPM